MQLTHVLQPGWRDIGSIGNKSLISCGYGATVLKIDLCEFQNQFSKPVQWPGRRITECQPGSNTPTLAAINSTS